MPFIKLNQPKYLKETNMLISDNDQDSTYFEVAEVPSYLTGGKNLLLIGGNNNLLKEGSNIEVEITDTNGNPIFHEVNQYIEYGTNKRVISIYVYESTPTGIGHIVIAGEAAKRPNGNSVPKSWQNTLNVKWTKRIRVYPFRENRTRVILKTPPVIKIKELIREYLIPSGGITTTVTESVGTTIDYEFGALGSGFSPGVGFGYITTPTSYFSASMVGSTISFTNISPTLESNETLTSYGPGGSQTQDYWTTQITEVINDTKAKINSSYAPLITVSTLVGNKSTDDEPSLQQIYKNVPGFTTANYSHTYQKDITWTSQTSNIESWAKVDISELDPMVGDLKKIRVLKRSQGFQQYELATEVNLDNKELLAKDDAFALQSLLGNFSEQSTIDNYWEASYNGTASSVGSLPTTSSNSSKFLGAVVISGSENLTSNYANSREEANIQFKMKSSVDWNGDGVNTEGVKLFKNGSYQVSFKMASENVEDGLEGSKIKVYLSGSAIATPSETNDKILLDTITNNGSAIVSPTSPANSSRKAMTIGRSSKGMNLAVSNNTTIQISQQPETDDNELVYDFSTYKDGTASLIFEVISGKWFIADVSFKSVKQSGFTPNHTSAEFRMFADTQQNDIFDFKFELYDNQNELIHTAFTQSLAWVGGNTSVTGDNNTIEGSLIIGNGILMKGISAQ
jgi:hypothetical protein